MVFRVVATSSGSIKATCKDAGKSKYENVASLAFDIATFRKLLTERFAYEMSLVKVENGFAVRNFLRIAFPSASSSQLLKDWFRVGFVREQLKNADLFKGIADMFGAIKSDIETNRKDGGGYTADAPP